MKLFFKIIDAKRQANDRDTAQNQVFGAIKKPSLFAQTYAAYEDKKSRENSRGNNAGNSRGNNTGNSRGNNAGNRNLSPYQVSIVPPDVPRVKKSSTLANQLIILQNSSQAIIDTNNFNDRNNVWQSDNNFMIQRSPNEEDKVEDLQSNNESRHMEESKILAIVNNELSRMNKEKEYHLNASKNEDNFDRMSNSSQGIRGVRRMNLSRQSAERNSMSFNVAEENDRLID